MLYIGFNRVSFYRDGRIVYERMPHEVDIDDNVLVRSFGYSFERDDRRVGNLIAAMIEDTEVYQFARISQFRQRLREITNNGYLVIINYYLHPLTRNFITIRMTGRRASDEAEANRRLNLDYTPHNYTWHHCENIFLQNGHWMCNMLLVQREYHRHPHSGGVHEYELFTNRTYM